MFDVISSGFKSAKNRFKGQTELSSENLKDALRDIRQSLLEADVEFKIVKK